MKQPAIDKRALCLRMLRTAKKARAEVNAIDHTTTYFKAKDIHERYRLACNQLGLWSSEILKLLREGK